MQIQKIEISNVLGLARADLTLTTPVTVITGNNEAGKSTLSDAISMAILGTPRRVKLKKELGQLLHDDAKKGRITIIGGGEALGEYRLPGGEHLVADDIKGKAFLEFVLDPAAFARLTEQDRRSTLFSLTGCKMSPDAVEQKLLARGVNAAMAAEVKPLLRSGFPSACKQAKENATAAKGAWRATTGENWGSEKAGDWAPAEPTIVVDPADLAASRKELENLAGDLEEAQQTLGAAKQSAQNAEQRAENITRLQSLAELAERRAAKLAVDEKDLAEWVEKLTTAEAAASGAPSVTTHECPHCQGLIEIGRLPSGPVKLSAYVEPSKVADPEAGKRAAEYRGYSDSAQRAVANSKRDLQESKDAAAQVVALKAEQDKTPSAEAIANAEQLINELRQERDKVQAKVTALADAQTAAEGRDKVIQAAAQHHAEVNAWLQIAEALAPDGIPGEILSAALTPVNDSLALLAGMAKWKAVQILDDMTINIGGRNYGLCSESSKWRADTLIALAIAQISGLRMVVLDRFDVLDLAGRAQLVGMLVQLSKVGAMDTMIMCGTMKALPKGLPQEVTAVWVENGIAETDPQ